MAVVHDKPLVVLPQAEDEFYVSSPSGDTYVDMRTTREDFFANVNVLSVFNANMSLANNLSVRGNTAYFSANVTVEAEVTVRSLEVGNTYFTISGNVTPTDSSDIIGEQGSIGWDGLYIYVQVSNTIVKRSALSSF